MFQLVPNIYSSPLPLPTQPTLPLSVYLPAVTHDGVSQVESIPQKNTMYTTILVTVSLIPTNYLTNDLLILNF